MYKKVLKIIKFLLSVINILELRNKTILTYIKLLSTFITILFTINFCYLRHRFQLFTYQKCPPYLPISLNNYTK